MANCWSNGAACCAVDLIELCVNCAVNCAGLSFLQGQPIMQPVTKLLVITESTVYKISFLNNINLNLSRWVESRGRGLNHDYVIWVIDSSKRGGLWP